ncbi:hypothetical protein BJV77DRAFT_1164099 [Russula vinacea]|nr:hypothetical protein BJV77DRAFT_1164099 [Russula vinacea]
MSPTRLFPGLVISGLDIGVASASEGFDDIDDIAGILGIGPIDLTFAFAVKPVSVSSNSTIVPFIKHGELTLAFGCTNSTKFSGPLHMWRGPRPYQRLLRTTLAQYANLKSLFFTIGDRTFEITVNA